MTMSRLILVSNLLPLKIEKNRKDEYELKPRIGGFASGFEKFYHEKNSVWVGWTGLDRREIPADKRDSITEELNKRNCFPVILRRREREQYLEGFANSTIWPLFHYYNEKSTYREAEWRQYVRVNQKYADELEKIVREDDRSLDP